MASTKVNATMAFAAIRDLKKPAINFTKGTMHHLPWNKNQSWATIISWFSLRITPNEALPQGKESPQMFKVAKSTELTGLRFEF